MELFQYNKKVTLEENIAFLEEILNKYLPMDYENLQKAYPFEMERKMTPWFKGMTAEEVLKKKTDNLDKVQANFQISLKNLKDKQKHKNQLK